MDNIVTKSDPDLDVDLFGLPLDTPPGEHPLDGYIRIMVDLLGYRTAARYFGIDPRTGDQYDIKRAED